jgi:hypothetical protein
MIENGHTMVTKGAARSFPDRLPEAIETTRSRRSVTPVGSCSRDALKAHSTGGVGTHPAHAHSDHYAGVVIDRGGRFDVRFPYARHLIGRADWGG